jgi:hypothetical protein
MHESAHMYHASDGRVLEMVQAPSPAHLVRSREPFPSLRRVLDEARRAGAWILAIMGVGAIGALPFLYTALVGG